MKNYSKPAVRPSTQRIYEGYIRLYIRPRLGRIPLNKLTANDLQQLFTWMKTDGGAESGLADSQVVNCHSLCHRALEKAVADRLIARNPADGCKLARPQARGDEDPLQGSHAETADPGERRKLL